MEWVSSWIQGIIIAVIISTIIEMILPEGTSKKYIKVVIGIYILFSIISPAISKITGNNFKISYVFDLDEYIETSKNSGTLQNKLTNQNENQIKEIYISSIKNDIKEKVENKGYNVKSIKVDVENDEQYTIKNINLQIEKEKNNDTEDKNTNQVVEAVNKIKIQVEENHNIIQNTQSNSQVTNTTSSTNKKSVISSQIKKELKQYLSGVYEIDIKNIFINE